MSSTSDDNLANLICKNCYVAIFDDHPTLPLWLKCRLCGFCKKKDIKQPIQLNSTDK